MLKQFFKRCVAVGITLLVFTSVFFSQSVQGEEMEISAQSAVLMVADTGALLYEKEAHVQRPMASTTKIMTALLTLEAAERLGDPIVEITKDMVAVEGSSMGLMPGDQLSLSGLAAGMLLASGNDAANAAAIYLDGSLESFVDKMNQRAQEIGMENTHFVTPSGLDGESEDGLGHYSTAYDMALLAREALKNQRFRELCSSSEYAVEFSESVKRVSYTNHNKLLTQYSGCVGVKTGFTKQAGRCLVSAAEKEGMLLIAVTLNAPDDWNDHTLLLDYGFSQMEAFHLAAGDVNGVVPVVGSEKESVGFTGGDGPAIALRRDDVKRIVRKVCIPAFLYAPVDLDDKIGEVRWYLDGELLGSVPITARESIPAQSKEPGFWARLFDKDR